MNDLDDIKQSIIAQAKVKHGKIYPCEGKAFTDCFTQEGDLLIFWCNDATGSTRIITRNIGVHKS
jgi:ABC-type sulfate transport system substrate-binding protein